METKRLFIALLPNDDTRRALHQTQEELAGYVTKARLSAPDNLHLTLAFLGTQTVDGEWAARDALKQTADQMAGRPLAHLELGPVGYFDKRKGGSVVWRGIKDNRSALQLRTLRELLRLRLGANGLQISENFTPHITLARGVRLEGAHQARVYRDFDALCDTLTEHAPATTLAPDRISLMWSHRVDDQLVYSEIGSVSW